MKVTIKSLAGVNKCQDKIIAVDEKYVCEKNLRRHKKIIIGMQNHLISRGEVFFLLLNRSIQHMRTENQNIPDDSTVLLSYQCIRKKRKIEKDEFLIYCEAL